MLEIRTTEELEDVALDRLRICYLDPFIGTKARHAALKNNYYFECKCEHCEAGYEYKIFYRNTCKSCITENHSKCSECNLVIDNQRSSEVLNERVKGYINGDFVNIESAIDIMENIMNVIDNKSIVFLQVAKLLFNQCLQAGRAEEALKYGELCIASYRDQTQLNPLGNVQTLLKLARLRNRCGLEFGDLLTEVMEMDSKYFHSERNRRKYLSIIDK